MIDELKLGKQEGLITLYKMYKRPLLYFSLQFVDKETAEEIVADTFIKVWELRKNFYSNEKLKAFLYISTKNACLNHLRKPQYSWKREDINDWDDNLYQEPEVYSKILQTELLKQIYDEISKLPEKQRDVFLMTYIEDMSVEEISKTLKISPNAVYIYRSRAINLLKNSFTLKDSLFLFLFLHDFL